MVDAYLTIDVLDSGVIVFDGEVDAVTATGIDDTLATAGPTIRLDLGRVSVIDSCGLHALLRAYQRPGTTLSIVNASANVRRLFQLAGVTDVLLPNADGRGRADDGDR